MFCKHKYDKINQFETKSQMELLQDIGAEVDGVWSYQLRKKYITDYVCEKCGKLKRFIVEN